MTLEDLMLEDEKLVKGYWNGQVTSEEFRKRSEEIGLLAYLVLGEDE